MPHPAQPAFSYGPLSVTDLVRYAGASGEFNPLHHDEAYARAAGLPGVMAHGMLSAAYVARAVTDWVPQKQLRSFAVRFTGITHLGNQPTVTGTIVEKFEANGEKRVKVQLTCANQYGEDKIVADAVVALN